MEIHVRYFAVFRERLGREEERLVLPEAATVNDALDALAARYDVIASLRGRFQTAVNQEMAPGDSALGDGDELALIPPVAGGSDAPPKGPTASVSGAADTVTTTGSREELPTDASVVAGPSPARLRYARLLAEPLSLDRVVAAVTSPETGGLVTFTGLVRRQNLGREVTGLTYEAYREMAERVFAKLCDDIERELPGTRLAVEHREGALTIGDAAVVIAAAAPHRAEAFTACRALIDRLKESAPIWKKETSTDGTEWIGLGP